MTTNEPAHFYSLHDDRLYYIMNILYNIAPRKFGYSADYAESVVPLA